MRALRLLLALPMLLFIGTAASGADVAVPAAPARWATDTAGFLRPQTVASLDDRLRAYESATGHQVLVYVAPSTGDVPTEDWTVRAFARWKVGRKGLDDGLVLFVFAADRKVRIEVGYGLEQTVPDVTAARIIRDAITPKLRAGQPDAAVTAGVDGVLAAIGGEAASRPDDAVGPGGKAVGAGDARPRAYATVAPYVPPGTDKDWGEIIGVWIGVLIGVLIIVGIIVLAAKLPQPKETYVSSGHGGGFGFGGLLLGAALGGIGAVSGFSGGGGMSGGGGATGSW